MKEDFIAYIWQHRLYEGLNLKTVGGEDLQVLSTGSLNHDAGPDFFNAKIKLGQTIWAGNVEIHVKSSDWLLHQHQKNQAYDNIILHLVVEQDVTIRRKSGEPIPTLELRKYVKQKLHQNFTYLQNNKDWIPCQKLIHEVDLFTLKNWMDRLLIERMEQKTQMIAKMLSLNKNDWEVTFYQYLGRSFGFKVNALPFELLTTQLPLSAVWKHKTQLLQIEAMLFGGAGFLEEEGGDEYQQNLKKEFDFLKAKFSLDTLPKHIWKFHRMRPSNFPTIRIAQFAQLLHQQDGLFSKVLSIKKLKDFFNLFSLQPSLYWQSHYVFGKETKKYGKRKMSRATIENLLLNAVVPFMFIYGQMTGKTDFEERSFALLEELKAEKNNILKGWESLNIEPKNAYESQALLQLKNKYCNAKRCLSCAVGNQLIRR